MYMYLLCMLNIKELVLTIELKMLNDKTFLGQKQCLTNVTLNIVMYATNKSHNYNKIQCLGGKVIIHYKIDSNCVFQDCIELYVWHSEQVGKE